MTSCPRCGDGGRVREVRRQWRRDWPPHWQRDVVIPTQRRQRLAALRERAAASSGSDAQLVR